MKKINITIVAIAIVGLMATSCTKEEVRIEGIGTITTRTLNIADFDKIASSGVDDVIIKYGAEQYVEVTGHPNIIDRIKTDVHNETWHCELENGTYGDYELTYYITIPSLEEVSTSGTGDVVITDSFTQQDMKIHLEGTGSFLGFMLTANNCQVDIAGTGNCEITVNSSLDVSIDGTGNVYYKGNPNIKDDISGTGKVIDAN
jgi:hypothetical protein